MAKAKHGWQKAASKQYMNENGGYRNMAKYRRK
jgi:hypothetical protein